MTSKPSGSSWRAPPISSSGPRACPTPISSNSNPEGDLGGALRLKPWFLAGPEQWWSHYEATKGSKLYATFGTWRENVGRSTAGARRRTAPLKRHNEESRDDALGRRKRLLIAAQPVFADLAARSARRPGHSALRAALGRHLGRDVSVRDARWLVSQLKKG